MQTQSSKNLKVCLICGFSSSYYPDHTPVSSKVLLLIYLNRAFGCKIKYAIHGYV